MSRSGAYETYSSVSKNERKVGCKFKAQFIIPNMEVAIKLNKTIYDELPNIEKATKLAMQNKLKTESPLSNIKIVPLSEESIPCLETQSTNAIFYIGILFDDDNNELMNYFQELDVMKRELEIVKLRLDELESSQDEVCILVLIERARDNFWERHGFAYIEQYKDIDNGDRLIITKYIDDTTGAVKRKYKPLSWKHFIDFIDLESVVEQSRWTLWFLKNEGREYFSEISDRIHQKSEGEIRKAVKRMNNENFIKLLKFMFPNSVAEI